MSGEQQLRAFVERILRLKEEQDTLAADIREVYAEAKGSGFDKTAMGQLVAHLRKVEKVGVAAVEEGQTAFDLYLDAYRRATGTAVATHTHEASQSYAEATGREPVDAKLVETVVKGVQTEIGRKALVVALDAMIEAEEAEPTVSEIEKVHHPVAPDQHFGTTPETSNSNASSLENSDLGTTPDEGIPAFLKRDRKPLRPNCLNPDNCAGYGSHTCHSCTVAAREVEPA